MFFSILTNRISTVCARIRYRNFTGISFVGPNPNRLNAEKRSRFAISKGTFWTQNGRRCFRSTRGSVTGFQPYSRSSPHETDFEIRVFLDRLVWRKSQCRPSGARDRTSETLTGEIKRAPYPLFDGRPGTTTLGVEEGG